MAACLAALSACASGYNSGPPGGPEDHVAPKIVKIVPDTNATGVRPRDMLVQFDGVISERPSGQATTLADLVLVSPRDGQANVDWHRDHITIRPRRGWRANTAYTVTILPGIADLHGNVANTTTRVMFSTGRTIPATTLSGTVFDWLQGTPLVNANVEAVARPDTTLVYVGTTDSTGRFSLQGLAPGSYLVRAYDDQSHNHALDRREPFDSATVALTNTAWTELLAFTHDSTGPQLGNVTVQDSVTLHAVFDTPLDPSKSLDVASFTLTAADSSRVTITAVAPLRPDTTRGSGTLRQIDSTGVPGVPIPPTPNRPVAPNNPVPQGNNPPARDSTPATQAPRPSKPLLYRDILITVAKPLPAKATFVLHAVNMRSPLGKTATSSRTFTTPAPPPPDTSAKGKTAPSQRGATPQLPGSGTPTQPTQPPAQQPPAPSPSPPAQPRR
jgi:hypothetical protein